MRWVWIRQKNTGRGYPGESRRAEAPEQSHSRMGNARASFLFGMLAVAALLCRTQASWGVALTLLLLGLVLTGI